MRGYISNVVIVFGDYDIEHIKRLLWFYYELEVDTVQTVTPDVPYRGEIRTEGNTLVHVATEITLSTGLYEMKYIDSTLPLDAVQMPTEALKRANLILVLMKDNEGALSYYPHTAALYCDQEDYY